MPEPTDVRKRLLTIAGIAAGVLLALFLFIAVIRPDEEEAPALKGEPSDATATAEPGERQAEAVRAGAPKPAKPVMSDPEDMYLKQLSRIFVERFGSYSNQNDNQHIADVLPISTERMQAYLQSQELQFARIYNGVTTIVIASRIETKSADQATVSADVQRVVRENGTERTGYQSGSVSLRKVNGEWKVDGLFWQ
jgi:hypothetical protein